MPPMPLPSLRRLGALVPALQQPPPLVRGTVPCTPKRTLVCCNRCAARCLTVLCCAVLCCAVLCCAVLCCAVPSCAVLG